MNNDINKFIACKILFIVFDDAMLSRCHYTDWDNIIKNVDHVIAELAKNYKKESFEVQMNLRLMYDSQFIYE